MFRFIPSLFFIFCFTVSFSQEVEWACKIMECTDEDRHEGFSPKEALGLPNVLPQNMKSASGQWLMGYTPGQLEPQKNAEIKVEFCKPIQAEQIAIAESFNPGAIIEVLLYEEHSVVPQKVYTAGAAFISEKGRMLNIFFPLTKHPVKAVKIVARPDLVQGWNGIDAIGIAASTVPIKAEINVADSIQFASAAQPLGSVINTTYDEKYPVIAPDGNTLYFGREGDPANVGSAKEDIWYSVKDNNGNWTTAKNIGRPLNNESYNGVVSITPDGNTLLLENVYNPDGSLEGGGASISTKTITSWSFPKKLNITNFYNKNFFCSFNLANDGRTLLLALEGEAAYGNVGDLDIYVSFLQSDGNWSTPMDLGPAINTPYAEGTPFLAADGVTMYFCSRGYIGYGDYDIYLSKRLDDTWKNWTKPVNLGPKINTAQGELGFSVPASGKFAYMYAYNNPVQKLDIYEVELSNTKSIQPEPVALISGRVFDAKTKLPLAAKIVYETLPEGKDAGVASSNPQNGEYKIAMPKGKFAYLAQASGYVSVNQNIDIENLQQYTEIQQDLYLVPIEVGQTVQLNNVFFIQSKPELLPSSYPELDRMVKFMLANPTVEIEVEGHTDNQGDPQKNMVLSEERVKLVKQYLTDRGIEAKRIELKAFGGSKPIASNVTEETRRLNRRVEFKILRK